MKKILMTLFLLGGVAEAKEFKFLDLLNLAGFTDSAGYRFTGLMKSTAMEGTLIHRTYSLTKANKNGRSTYTVDAFSKPNSKVVDRVTMTFDHIYDFTRSDAQEVDNRAGEMAGFLTLIIPTRCYGLKLQETDQRIDAVFHAISDRLAKQTTATSKVDFDNNMQVRFDNTPNGLAMSWIALKPARKDFCTF